MAILDFSPLPIQYRYLKGQAWDIPIHLQENILGSFEDYFLEAYIILNGTVIDTLNVSNGGIIISENGRVLNIYKDWFTLSANNSKDIWKQLIKGNVELQLFASDNAGKDSVPFLFRIEITETPDVTTERVNPDYFHTLTLVDGFFVKAATSSLYNLTVEASQEATQARDETVQANEAVQEIKQPLLDASVAAVEANEAVQQIKQPLLDASEEAIQAKTDAETAAAIATSKSALNPYVLNRYATFRAGEIEALKVLKNIRIECATANLSDVWVVKAFTKSWTIAGFENYIELRNTRTGTGVSRNFSAAELTAGYADILLNSISGYTNMFARVWFDYSQTTQTGLLISSSDTSNIAIVPVTVADLTATTANITANALRINTLNPYLLNRYATFRSGEIEALKVLKNIRIECATANLSDVWVVRAFTKNWTTTGYENLIDLRNTRTGTGVSRNFSAAELTAGYADISLNSISGYANMFARIWFDYSQTTSTGLLISSSDTSNIAIVPVTVADLTANTANIATLQTATTQNTADLSTMKKTTYAIVNGTPASAQGFYFQSTGVWTPYAGYLTILYDVSAITSKIYATATKINGTGTALAVYFDASMNRLGREFVGTTSNVAYTRQLLTRPANTKYVALCNFSSTEYPYLEQAVQTLVDVVTVEAKVLTAESNIATISSRNHHGGKKIVWLGTSVPFGQNSTKSYAQEAATKLGFTLVNASVPGQAIHADNISGVITPKTYGSTVCSKAEYAAAGWTIQSSPVTPYVPGGSYNNYYRTWENIFVAENADASLWVFDVAPNNADFSMTDWNAFNKSAWAYNDGSSFDAHRTTFYGAILFLMNKMYALNPNARMVFVLGSDYAYTSGKTAFETISAQWSIPIVDVWRKINKTSKSLEVVKSLGGTDWHPSTFAHEKLGDMIANELLLIS